jgi:tRNA G18 (ribose-2'-O)-methylase SpoU
MVINGLRNKGVQIVALEQTPNSVDYRRFVYQWPVAVIFGHEVTGVRPETLSLCDGVVHIPMLGHKVSLNVSVAAGVMLYELLTQFQNSNV